MHGPTIKCYVYRARKLLNLRLFEEPTSGKGWEKSVSDLGLEILCVSQVSLINTFNTLPAQIFQSVYVVI